MKNEIEEKITFNHAGGKLRRVGPSKCTEKELLSIIINTGTKKYSAAKIAEVLLTKFGNIYNLQGKEMSELMEVEGIGAVKATQLVAVFELCRRIVIHLEQES